MRLFVTAIAFGLTFVGAAQAATLNEADIAGGFNVTNGQPVSYTDVGRDFDTITGGVTANQFDMLRFTSLDAGAQSITFNFEIDNTNPPFFQNAGGTLRYAEVPAGSPFDGTNAGQYEVRAGPGVDAALNTTSLTFNLDSSFAGGPLFVQLLPTFGGQVNYSIALTGNGGGVAPIPLPATGVLLLGALVFGPRLLRRGRRDALPAI